MFAVLFGGVPGVDWRMDVVIHQHLPLHLLIPFRRSRHIPRLRPFSKRCGRLRPLRFSSSVHMVVHLDRSVVVQRQTGSELPTKSRVHGGFETPLAGLGGRIDGLHDYSVSVRWFIGAGAGGPAILDV